MIICIKEPGKQIQYRVVTEISLKLLQDLVGGYIELTPAPGLTRNKIGVPVNEEGLLKKLPFNLFWGGNPIVGTVVFVRIAGEDFAGLTDDQIRYLNICFEKGEVK